VPDFSLVIDAGVTIAETPIWDSRVKKLYWTDLFTGFVHRYDPLTGKDERFKTLDSPIGSAVPSDDPDKLLVALDSGLYLLNLKTEGLQRIVNPEPGRPENCFNDVRVDAAGRIIGSTTAKIYGMPGYTPDMTGNFYLVDTGGSVKILAENIAHYNGIVWNGANTKMFVVDSFNEKLLAWNYDIEKGPLGDSETAIDLGEFGNPDGISIDTEDNLYICHWTGKISVWDKNLKLKESIPFPVPFVCCGGFGGEDFSDFYVASATWDYTPEEASRHLGAGGIFMAKNAVRGVADHFYSIRKEAKNG
jgi:sugar lactone lactonase YvrE